MRSTSTVRTFIGHVYLGYLPAPPGLTFQPGCYPGCGGLPVLYLLTETNIVKAVYQGFESSVRIPLLHDLTLDASYNTQSAFPLGETPYQENLLRFVVNDQQLIGVPLHKYLASLNYTNRLTGAGAYMDWNFYDKNNTFGQVPFSVYDLGAAIPMNRSDKLHLTWSNIFNAGFIDPPFPGETIPLPLGSPPNYALFPSAPRSVSYPGYSGPVGLDASPSAPHALTVTYEHTWGSLLQSP